MINVKESFGSILPYEDKEVTQVIKSLINDKNFHKEIASKVYPSFIKIIPGLGSFLFKRSFIKNFSTSKSLEEFQNKLAPFVSKMIEKTTDGFTYSGKENLDNQATLYISNHRDIALDPLFLNFARYVEGFRTTRIAIGDNLLDSSFFEKLMRLNKSFIVHRNIKGAKETLRKLTNLSRYINHSISLDKESIWIAQLEGRANDGNDFTDIAVIKMLYLSERKKCSLNEWIQKVNLTPVSISYEYDPLDIIKAKGWEGWESLTHEENNKRDLNELVSGLRGNKGRVHLHIGKKITNKVKNFEHLVEILDEKIISNYKLWPSNYISAYENGLTKDKKGFENKRGIFLSRLNGVKEQVKKEVLEMYSAPYKNKKGLNH